MQASDYQDIGRYLSDSRDSLRITLSQAARDLNIRVRYLEALETGNLSEMPGKAYIRGYARNYAQYLGLNTKEVLDAYDALLGPKAHELFIPAQTLEQHLPTRTLLSLSLAGLLALYGVWYFAFHDRTQAERTVSALPEPLAHLLAPPPAPPVVLPAPWRDCLESGEAACGLWLRVRELTPFYAASYPLQSLDSASVVKPDQPLKPAPSPKKPPAPAPSAPSSNDDDDTAPATDAEQ